MSDDLQAGGSSVMEAHRRSNKDDQQLFLEELDKRDSVIALLTQRLKEVQLHYNSLTLTHHDSLTSLYILIML